MTAIRRYGIGETVRVSDRERSEWSGFVGTVVAWHQQALAALVSFADGEGRHAFGGGRSWVGAERLEPGDADQTPA